MKAINRQKRKLPLTTPMPQSGFRAPKRNTNPLSPPSASPQLQPESRSLDPDGAAGGKFVTPTAAEVGLKMTANGALVRVLAGGFA